MDGSQSTRVEESKGRTIGLQGNNIERGNRIVVPNTGRNRAVDLAHVGHQGIVKTKQLIREKVWFPGVEKMVKEKVGSNYLQGTVTRTSTDDNCYQPLPGKNSR